MMSLGLCTGNLKFVEACDWPKINQSAFQQWTMQRPYFCHGHLSLGPPSHKQICQRRKYTELVSSHPLLFKCLLCTLQASESGEQNPG